MSILNSGELFSGLQQAEVYVLVGNLKLNRGLKTGPCVVYAVDILWSATCFSLRAAWAAASLAIGTL